MDICEKRKIKLCDIRHNLLYKVFLRNLDIINAYEEIYMYIYIFIMFTFLISLALEEKYDMHLLDLVMAYLYKAF